MTPFGDLILFDDPQIRAALLPFTFTRPVSHIRVGMLTIAEKWEKWMGAKPTYQTEAYLQKKFPGSASGQGFLINGALCPDENLVEALKGLSPGQYLVKGNILLAAYQPGVKMNEKNVREYTDPVVIIDRTWRIFRENAAQLKIDFKLVTAGRQSGELPDKHTIVYGGENLFVEEGVYVRAAVINAEPGPVYLGKNSIIQEGALIRGSFSLGEGAHVNMGAKVRGDTSVGPFCKIGGEISNSVIFGYSNKSHDGFLGNSVIGEWCNLGADTNTSNMKNNYGMPKLWNHAAATYEETGLNFCGLMMGDHSKCGINTMFNTATVVDVAANIFGEGYLPHHIPSFAWGGSGGKYLTHLPDKVLETAARVMERRNVMLTEVDKDILSHIFELTGRHRHWESKR